MNTPPTSLKPTLPAPHDKPRQPNLALLTLMSTIDVLPIPMVALVPLPQILHLRSNASCSYRNIVGLGLPPHDRICPV